MPDKTINLEIFTPEGKVFSGKVISFTVPGTLGAFQVLHNHAPIISSLEVGEVKVVDESNNTIFFAISGGFVEVARNNATILADSAERYDEIDVQRAKLAKERALKRMKDRSSEVDKIRAELAYRRAINRIRVAGKKT